MDAEIFAIRGGVVSMGQSYSLPFAPNGKPQKPVYFVRRYKNMTWEVLW
jgi:hypothetical protein